jgi:hypothetical protein
VISEKENTRIGRGNRAPTLNANADIEYQRKAKSIYAYCRLSHFKVMPFDRLRASGFQRVRAELVEAHY